MGTLHHQLPRFDHLSDDRIKSFIDHIKMVSDAKGISYKECLETVKLLATIDNYDTKDEQLDGLGDIFENFVDELTLFNGGHDERISAFGDIADAIYGIGGDK